MSHDSHSYVLSYHDVDAEGRDVIHFVPARPAGGESVTSSLNSGLKRALSSSDDVPQPPSSPVVGETEFDPETPRRKTGRRGKSSDKPRRGERSPEGAQVIVAEDKAALRDLLLLTREQAAVLAGVGLNKIDEWSRDADCDFLIRERAHFVRISRVRFEAFLERLAERYAREAELRRQMDLQRAQLLAERPAGKRARPRKES